MAISDAIRNSGPRDRKILWIEFAVIFGYAYIFSVATAWIPMGSPARSPLVTPYRFTEEIAKLLPLLFIVAVADGTLKTIGVKRPVWKVDALLSVGLIAFMFFLEFGVAKGLPHDVYLRLRQMGRPSELHEEVFAGASLIAMLPATIASVAFQELLTRGYLMGRLRELTNTWWIPVLASTVLFGAWHLYQGPIGIFETALIGFVFGLVYMRTERIWPMIIAHFVFNEWATWRVYEAHQHVLALLSHIRPLQ